MILILITYWRQSILNRCSPTLEPTTPCTQKSTLFQPFQKSTKIILILLKCIEHELYGKCAIQMHYSYYYYWINIKAATSCVRPGLHSRDACTIKLILLIIEWAEDSLESDISLIVSLICTRTVHTLVHHLLTDALCNVHYFYTVYMQYISQWFFYFGESRLVRLVKFAFERALCTVQVCKLLVTYHITLIHYY